MDLSQPWGALGLLAVPAFVLVHLLQQRPPVVAVTTLFLLPATHARTPRGRRVRRLSRRAQLAIRILAALVATWLLVGPRFPPSEALRVAVVLDTSASMAPVRSRAKAALDAALEQLGAGRDLELVVLSSAPGAVALGTGDRDALGVALEGWDPKVGAHDLSEAFARARRAAGPQGAVLFVTDHAGEGPQDVLRIAIGESLDNVAFTGITVRSTAEGPIWEATVRAFTAGPVTRRWWVEAGAARGAEGRLDLAPGETRRLSGRFPEGLDRFELVLEPDRLPIDDRVPVLRPRRRTLKVRVDGAAAKIPLVTRLLQAAPRVERVESEAAADLVVRTGTEPPKASGGPPSLWLLTDPGLELRPPAVGAVAVPDPLTARLGWAGLVFRAPRARRLPEGGRALLWHEDRPIAWIAADGGFGLGIDPRGGSAPRNAPLVVLLSRYLEQVRARVPRAEALLVEVGQVLTVPAAPNGGLVELRAGEEVQTRQPGQPLFAPSTPGYFTVRQGQDVLLEGAARFADVRESDLREGSTSGPEDVLVEAARGRGSREDPWRTHWILVLVALALASFALGARGAP